MTSSTISTSLSGRKTKIVATVGPACRSPEQIRDLITAGVNVFRLNFSHGSHDEHLQTLTIIRKESGALNIPVGILQDLSGPKMRISLVSGDSVQIPDGDLIELVYAATQPADGQLTTAKRIVLPVFNPVEVLLEGHRILLADGNLELGVVSNDSKKVTCKVIKGGLLRSRVGIAFPDSAINLPATTAKDIEDFRWGLEHKVDFVAISFVQNAADILRLRQLTSEKSCEVRLIAKIERKIALDNISEILDAADGLMVARGDLGLELPLEQVPHAQTMLIAEANLRGLPVIVATQMLQSMVTSLRPTRAEATDVAFAVMSGTDAVMLSEETAVGEHPVECVRYLSRIAQEAERSLAPDGGILSFKETSERLPVSDAIALAACAAAHKVRAMAIIACSTSGNSARLVSKYRPAQPIFGVSTVEHTLRRMSLYWGVIPVKVSPSAETRDEIESALLAVQRTARLPAGSQAVITGSGIIHTPGATNIMEVRDLPVP